MEMTIEKSKEWLKLAVPIKALTQEEFETFIQAVNFAVDTMHKYREIEEIVKEWREVGLDYDSCDAMDNIERVIEDGNDV